MIAMVVPRTAEAGVVDLIHAGQRKRLAVLQVVDRHLLDPQDLGVGGKSLDRRFVGHRGETVEASISIQRLERASIHRRDHPDLDLLDARMELLDAAAALIGERAFRGLLHRIEAHDHRDRSARGGTATLGPRRLDLLHQDGRDLPGSRERAGIGAGRMQDGRDSQNEHHHPKKTRLTSHFSSPRKGGRVDPGAEGSGGCERPVRFEEHVRSCAPGPQSAEEQMLLFRWIEAGKALEPPRRVVASIAPGGAAPRAGRHRVRRPADQALGRRSTAFDTGGTLRR